MVEGIDILNTTEIMRDPIQVPLLLGLFVLLFFVGFGIFIYGAYEGSIVHSIMAIGMIILSIVSLYLACSKEGTEPTGRYRYEAIIDDSVSFLDLQEKYDVIEQNGRIWVLEDKETEE